MQFLAGGLTGIVVAYSLLVSAMWFYGHGGDWDTPYKRGPDGWRLRSHDGR